MILVALILSILVPCASWDSRFDSWCMHESECPWHDCGSACWCNFPGYERVWGDLSQYINSMCKPCPVGTFSLNSGFQSCTPCPEFSYNQHDKLRPIHNPLFVGLASSTCVLMCDARAPVLSCMSACKLQPHDVSAPVPSQTIASFLL